MYLIQITNVFDCQNQNLARFKFMLKTESKKPSKQFINYLKDNQNMPLAKAQQSKGSQTGSEHPHPVKKYYGPIEGDFSKIGCTYILQNDRLRKKTPLYGRQRIEQDHNQTSDPTVEVEDVEMIKEIAKLQFLEKKGFLKPEETQRLNQLRGEQEIPNSAKIQQPQQKSQNTIPPNQKMLPFPSNDYDEENINPNIYYEEYMPQKNHHYPSMKPHPHQNHHHQHPTYQPYEFQTPKRFYQDNVGYGNQFTGQSYNSHHNYY